MRRLPPNGRSAPPTLEIRNTRQYGRGVFAAENVTKGTVVHVLGGRTISLGELVQLVGSGEEPLDDPLQVGRKTYLVLDELSRSFNHSCVPNAGVRKRSELFALRDIRRGEEVTYDYSTTIAPTTWAMQCRCNSAWCRGVIGDVRSIPKKQLQYYEGAGAIQRYMKQIMARTGWRAVVPDYERKALERLGPRPTRRKGEDA